MTEEYQGIKEDIQAAMEGFQILYEKVHEHAESYTVDECYDAIDKMRDYVRSMERDNKLLANEVIGIRDPELKLACTDEHAALADTIRGKKEGLELLAARTREAFVEKGVENDGPMTDTQKLGAAVVLHEAMNTDIDDAIMDMQQVTVLNDAIIESLEKDMERLNRVSDELDGLQSDALLARRQIKRLLVRLAGNKCLMMVLLIVLLVIMGFSIANLVADVRSGKNKPSPSPNSTSTSM